MQHSSALKGVELLLTEAMLPQQPGKKKNQWKVKEEVTLPPAVELEEVQHKAAQHQANDPTHPMAMSLKAVEPHTHT